MSRLKNASRNIKYGYIGSLINILLKFAVRTVFIYSIGITYLGIDGLYSNILSVLSLAELGIGTTMNYSLYKPIAENNVEKIKSLMQLYKKAYRWIATVVGVLGLLVVPFLNHIIKDPGVISSREIVLYYLVFLFNTVSTYFISYKYSLANADQRNYIQTNIRTITAVVVSAIQIFMLIIFKSFLLYLLSSAIIELIQKIFANRYINNRYPFLLDDSIMELSKEDKEPIIKNIKALVYHKIGDVSALQTDNIIISSFINISTVGLMTNYTMIITSVTSFIDIMFNSVVSGFGNLIATEGQERQYKLFKVYRFAGFWFYGFATIAFVILISPFIELWLGNEMVVNRVVIYLILMDYYAKGHRTVVNNFKVAAGLFDEDKYLAFIRGIVNLIVSIIMVRVIGLPGIYIGTVISGLIPSLIRPKIVYNKIFNLSVKEYYKDSIIYLSILLIPLLLLDSFKKTFFLENSAINFLILTISVVLVVNLMFYIMLKKREEFRYLRDIIIDKVKRG